MQRPIIDLGLVDYCQALQRQKELFEQVRSGALRSALVFCRHHPVITLGRQAKTEALKADRDLLSCLGIPVYPIERGGNVTYHGPGQLMVYPIVALIDFKKDIRLFLRWLELSVVDVLEEFGIDSCLRDGLTGVWVGERKICSIGIAVKNWISYHGLALNVGKDDLANFSLIRPCGMDIKMTSLETVLKSAVSFAEVQKKITRRFEYA